MQYPGRLVTVLSNSRDNGAEFVRKCAEVCRKMPQEFEVEGDFPGSEAPPGLSSSSPQPNGFPSPPLVSPPET